ncbi:MAG: right-handed parallel beta-helix repeat-containing protein, partial [Candidatus Saccharimonadales bacterium]|nr:right-handed parallel beta-helix repeat-containing protein [Candidatus Saccharimonadales bacterium]
ELSGPGAVTVTAGDPQPPADSDGDGIPDSEDNCPNEWGPASNGGCPETGGDPGYSYKDGVGPRDISCNGVTLDPGDNIESASNSNSNDTTFCLNPGTYYNQSVTPKDGQKFIGLNGATLDGNHSTTYAFSGGANNIHIENLIIKNYEPPDQMGAIKGGDHGVSQGTYGWQIIRNEIAYNRAGGIRTGHEMLIQGNAIHHNEQIGIAGSGDDMIVEGNEIAYNNYLERYDWGWEAGGTKFVRTNRLIVRNNESHHNTGPGLWTDISNINTLYENNTVHDNIDGPGIFHEISYAATIRDNHIYNNGYPDSDPNNIYWTRSGIQISASKDVEVYNNLLENNSKGITGVDQCRGDGDFGPYSLTNVNVYNNTIIDSRLSRAGTDCNSYIDMEYYNNTWLGNSRLE